MRSSTYYTAALMAAAALLLMSCLSSSHGGGVERSEYRGGPRSEEAYREMFAEFMTKFGKTYDMAEQERRYAAFKDAICDADKLTFSRYYMKLHHGPIVSPTRSSEETRNMFKQWMAIHGKTYDSETEWSDGFVRFKINLERVHRHNNAAFVSFSSYRLSLDRFADLHYHRVCYQVPGAHHGTGGVFNNNLVGLNMFIAARLLAFAILAQQ